MTTPMNALGRINIRPRKCSAIPPGNTLRITANASQNGQVAAYAIVMARASRCEKPDRLNFRNIHHVAALTGKIVATGPIISF